MVEEVRWVKKMTLGLFKSISIGEHKHGVMIKPQLLTHNISYIVHGDNMMIYQTYIGHTNHLILGR